MKCTLTLLVILVSMSTKVYPSVTTPEIAIIGAGISGLTAALRLSQKNYSVNVYEARGRVGGRIHSAYLNGQPIELGAESINDGGEAKNLKKLISEFNLELCSQTVLNNRIYKEADVAISSHDLVREIDEDEVEAILNTNFGNMQEILAKISIPGSYLYSYLSSCLSGYEGGDISELSYIYKENLKYLLKGGLCTAHQNETAQLTRLKKGNAHLTTTIANELGEKVHLDHQLLKVCINDQNKFHLTFANERQVCADILVLAIPCSVYESIDFGDAVIPSDLLDKIMQVKYGQNAKIIVETKSCQDRAQSVVTSKFVSFCSSNPTNLNLYFVKQASSFDKATITKTFSDSLDLIKSDYNGLSLGEVELATDHPEQHYSTAVGYSWPLDPFSKGSYSFISAGTEKDQLELTNFMGETIKKLFTPLNNKLFFIGEHTSKLKDVGGTMEAACESGESVARIIDKLLENAG